MAIDSVGGNGVAPPDQHAADTSFQNSMERFQAVATKLQVQQETLREATSTFSMLKKVSEAQV